MIRHLLWIGVTSCVPIVLVGCARDENPSAVTVTTDAMGVEVVTSPHLLRLDDHRYQWSLELTRQFDTASDDPTTAPRIWNPESISRAPDGSLVIADRGPHRIVVLRNDSIVARFGSRGSGPGEIRVENGGLVVLPMPDSTITVVELWGNARIHRFSASGELLGDTQLRTLASAWSVGRGFTEITVQLATPGQSPDDPFEQHVARLDLRTGETEFAAPLPRAVGPAPGGQPRFYPLRFWAALPSGGVATMRTDSGRITYHGLRGEVERQIDLPISPSPMTPEVRARVEEQYPAGPGQRYAPYRRLVRKLVAVNDSLVALEHSWLTVPAEETIADQRRIVWRLISATGHQRGTVTFPESFDPWLSKDGYILGIRQDSLGVAVIQEYVLLPPG